MRQSGGIQKKTKNNNNTEVWWWYAHMLFYLFFFFKGIFDAVADRHHEDNGLGDGCCQKLKTVHHGLYVYTTNTFISNKYKQPR